MKEKNLKYDVIVKKSKEWLRKNLEEMLEDIPDNKLLSLNVNIEIRWDEE